MWWAFPSPLFFLKAMANAVVKDNAKLMAFDDLKALATCEDPWRMVRVINKVRNDLFDAGFDNAEVQQIVQEYLP